MYTAAHNVQPNDVSRNRTHVVDAVNAGALAPVKLAANAVSGGGGPLEMIASIASPPPAAVRLRRRYNLQTTSARLLPDMRVARCLRTPTATVGGVGVVYHPKSQSASFTGLQTCGSIHVCPVCAAKIAERRAEEVTTAYDRWTAGGGAVLMLTLTLRHKKSDDLIDLVKVLNDSSRRLRAGAKWQRWKDRLGIVGTITAREYTYGAFGWHPHLHMLIFVRNVGQPWLDEFARWVKHTWLTALTALGASGVTTAQDLRIATSRDQSEYVTKLGHGIRWTVGDELTKLNSKTGRQGNQTPWDLLADAGHGDADAAERWIEYAKATFGRNALAWSQGLRSLLDMQPELSDEEIAAQQEEDGIALIVMDFDCWRHVLARDARAELLVVGSSGNAETVRQFLLDLLE